MPIAYEELGGSPRIVMNREGGNARRIVKIAWSDIGRAILEIFPGAAFGYPYTASMPGFPWLRAATMDIEPFDPDNPTGTGQIMNTYPTGAKVTVGYETLKWPDPNSSKFDNGPDNGDLNDVTFLEQRLTFGGEYLTWPNNGVKWAKDVNGNVPAGSGGAGAGGAVPAVVVYQDVNVGVVIPTIEHELTWNYVAFPPWSAIRSCLGKVNGDVHMNCFPETLLFNGAVAERTYSILGAPTWKLTYRISEKCYNYPIGATRGLSAVGVSAAGRGYTVNDVLTILGGTGTAATVTVTAVNGAGGVTGVVINSIGNYGLLGIPGSPAPTAGGTGTGATMSCSFLLPIRSEVKGWNHFLRPNTGQFERMLRKDGTGIYQFATFASLYGTGP